MGRANDLFIRVIAEKSPTQVDGKKPQPGQLGDPNKERYASQLIPVAITNRDEPGMNIISDTSKSFLSIYI